MPENPFLGDGGQNLSRLLMSLGSGMSMASAANQPWWAGIGPAAAIYGQSQAADEDRAYRQRQMEENNKYRLLQEEALRGQIEESKRQADLDSNLMMGLGRLTGQGMPGVGMGVTPQPAVMGGGQNVNPNNIGNVRPVGGGPGSGFQQPASFDDGVRLAVQNAQAYPSQFNNGQPMSLLQIGERWAPKGDGANDPAQWAKNVASIGGLPVDQPLDFSNPQVRAQFARGVHGAEHGANAVRPIDAYMPGATGVQPVQYQQGANPQITPQGVMPPRVDPAQGLPFLLSKRLAPIGKGIIDWGNTETNRYSQDQDRAAKQDQFNREQSLREQNAAVLNGKPNQPVIDAEAAKKRAEAEAQLDSTAATTLVQSAVKEFVDKERPKGLAIQETIPQLHNIRRLVEAGAMNGTGTETRNALAQLAATVGFKSNEASITPAYLAALKDQIVSNAKALGVNPSNRDTELLEQAKGATSGNSKDAVLTMLGIQEQIQRKAHDRYIAEAKRIQGMRGVKQAYGEDYFNLPEPPTYGEYIKDNPLPAVQSPVNRPSLQTFGGPTQGQTPMPGTKPPLSSFGR